MKKTFALLLALGRTLYSKKPVSILKVMLAGMTGAFICYIISGLTMNIYIAVAACALTGLCASMLWPGTLIYLGGKIPDASVSVYALMAAGGDMGASVVPQLVGIIADITGIQAGILTSSLFPAMGIIIIGATLIKGRTSK